MNQSLINRLLAAGHNSGIDCTYDELRGAVHMYGGDLDGTDIENIITEFNGPIDDLVYTSITSNGYDHHIIVTQAHRER